MRCGAVPDFEMGSRQAEQGRGIAAGEEALAKAEAGVAARGCFTVQLREGQPPPWETLEGPPLQTRRPPTTLQIYLAV